MSKKGSKNFKKTANTFLSKTYDEKMKHKWKATDWVCLESGLDHCTVEELECVLQSEDYFGRYYYAVHDDPQENHPHFHCVVEIKKEIRNSTLLNLFDSLTGRERSMNLEPVKYSLEASIVYLTHATDDAKNKVQYDSSIVHGYNGDEDAQKYYQSCLSRYEKTKEINSKKQAELALLTEGWLYPYTEESDGYSYTDMINTYYEAIKTGKLRHSNYIKILPITEDFARRNIIDKVFKRVEDEYRQNIDNSWRSIRVYWFVGEPGTGKTTYAMYLCNESGKSFFKAASGKHPFDKYTDESFVLLDDLRPEVFTANELLNVLTPYVGGDVAARYSDKLMMFDTIIITCPQTPEQWWEGHYQEHDYFAGDVKQLTRRINGGVYRFNRNGNYEITTYDLSTGHKTGTRKYELPQSYYDYLKEMDEKYPVPDLITAKFTTSEYLTGEEDYDPNSLPESYFIEARQIYDEINGITKSARFVNRKRKIEKKI